MKFYHLARQRDLKRILKNGLRLGSKRAQRGRGIYCIPEAFLHHTDLKNQHAAENRHFWNSDEEPLAYKDLPKFKTGLIHTSNLWKFLFRYGKNYPAGTQAVLIVFKIPENFYPIRFYLPCKLEDEDYKNIPIDHLKWEEGMESIRLMPKSAKEIGMALHYWVQKGWTPSYSAWDDDVEIILKHPIKPRFITNVIPMYRTNRMFKIKKINEKSSNWRSEY